MNRLTSDNQRALFLPWASYWTAFFERIAEAERIRKSPPPPLGASEPPPTSVVGGEGIEPPTLSV